MASEWRTDLLGNLCLMKNGYAFKSKDFVSQGVPVIKIKNVKPNRILVDDLSYVPADVAEQRKKWLIEKGEILLTMTGNRADGSPESWVGKAAIFNENTPYLLNQRVSALKAKDETVIDTYYLGYYLSSWQTQLYFIKRANSSGGQANISPEIVMNMPVNYPPLATQKKIVSILAALDQKINTNAVINDNLQEQAQTLFAERFYLRNSDPIPEGWSLVSLGDVAVISNKSFNPLKQPETMLEHYSIPAFDEKRYPVFELSTEIKSNKFIVDSDCFMISKLNPTTKRVWRPYCMTENAVCSTEFIVYKAKVRELTDFLYSLIDSASFSDFMCSHVTGSTGSRQRTTPSDTLQYQFYMPTADEIADFSAVVAPMYAQIRINAMENARLKGLRDSLLPRLMSGEIDVADMDA